MSTFKKIAWGTVSSLVLSTAAWAQSHDIVLQEYSLGVNDCETCPPVADINSEAEFIDYMNTALASDQSGSTGGQGGFFGGGQNLFGNLPFQIVHLDFQGDSPTFPVCAIDENGDISLFGVFNDYVYSQAQRDEIQARISEDYAQFGYFFTQTAPFGLPFSSVKFNINDAPLDCSEGSNITVRPGGRLTATFGRADAIDFGNANKSNTAIVASNIWSFLSQISVGAFESFSQLDVDAQFGGDLNAATSFAELGQSSNTGAHELGHTVGLRHQNSFGAPGDGLPNTGAISPFDFVPVFNGPSNADETILHTMASGVSVGLPFDGGVNLDRFFSERSAIRLAANQSIDRITTTEAAANSAIDLKRLLVPNTILEGQNADEFWDVKASVVDGTISAAGEVDSYTFEGKQGDFFNAEIIPYFAQGQNILDGILGQILIFKVDENGNETFLGGNARSFENPFDTEVFDFELPEDGLYSVKVVAPDIFFVDFDNDGIIDAVPLTALNGGAQLLTGDYKLLAFTSDFSVLDDFGIDALRDLEANFMSKFSHLINQ